MEVIEHRGGRRPGAGRKKKIGTQLRDAIGEVDLPKIIKNLEKWSEGKEVVCSQCGEKSGVYVPDTIALQSAIELLNRRLGKVPQQVQVDITEKIELSADQCDILIEKHLPAIIALLEQRYPQVKGLLTQGTIQADYKVIE